MARIATVCTDERRGTERVDMGAIRWYEMSHVLAELGHEVDIVHGRSKWKLRQPVRSLGPRLREVPLSRVRWEEYDVVKTLFHRGFETLERWGGADHPFIISKLGSVVGPEDREGIYFYGARRAELFRTQERIDRASRYVAVLSEPARELWRESHGRHDGILLVPGACRGELPAPVSDPYPSRADGSARVVFAGNFYSSHRRSQPEAHRIITGKLNGLGRVLDARGARLFVIGPGEERSLDATHVTYLGQIPYERSWDYLRCADVGLVVSAGPFMHNNESTKIYHYLRVGLPVVSEAGFPNEELVLSTGHGRVVPAGDADALAEAIVEASTATWDRSAAADFILRKHTWSVRAAIYHAVIEREVGATSGRGEL